MRQAESFQERGKPRKTPEKCRFVKSWAISAYMYAVDRPIFQKLAFSRGFAAFSARFESTRQTAQICCDSDIWAQKQWENGVRDPTPPHTTDTGKTPKKIFGKQKVGLLRRRNPRKNGENGVLP